MDKRIVFVHGWGLGPDFWDEMTPLFPEYECAFVDFGFVGKEDLSAAGPAVYVTHSLGTLWALKNCSEHMSALVAINGFGSFRRFATKENLAELKESLLKDPAAHMKGFWESIGVNILHNAIPVEDDAINAVSTVDAVSAATRGTHDPPGERKGGTGNPVKRINVERLTEGLDWLAGWNGRAELKKLKCPVLSLAGTQDKILPLEQMQKEWAGFEMLVHEEGGHALPQTHAAWCVQQIKDLSVAKPTWKEKIAGSFDGSAEGYDQYSEIQELAAAHLTQELPVLQQPKVLEIGCGTGLLTRKLLEKYPDGEFQITDISSRMVERAKSQVNGSAKIDWAVMDGEKPSCAGSFDLIISNMSFQWFEDAPGAIKKLRQYLMPGGKIFYSVPGPESFKEWKSVLSDLGLQSGVLNFPDLPGVFKEESHIIHYDSALSFLQSIKAIGAGTPRPDYKVLGYTDMKRACRRFDQQFEGQVSWHIQYGCISA